MPDPKPITLEQVDTGDYEGAYDPQPFLLVGELPEASLTPAAFVAVDSTPADATAVATDLIAVRDALIAAGFMAAS